MIRQHEQAVLQVCVIMFVLSFLCAVIKYKIACNVTTFVSIIHTNSRKIVTVQELRLFV
jgi:cytochrome c oxidase assembly protein Cox11